MGFDESAGGRLQQRLHHGTQKFRIYPGSRARQGESAQDPAAGSVVNKNNQVKLTVRKMHCP